MGAAWAPWASHGMPWAPHGPLHGHPYALHGLLPDPKLSELYVLRARNHYFCWAHLGIVRSACTKRLLLLKTSVSCRRNPYFLGCSICTVCTRVLRGRALNPCACAQKQRGHFGGITQNTLAAISSNNWPKPRPPDLPFHTRPDLGWREYTNSLK